jgi:hypothetical protein
MRMSLKTVMNPHRKKSEVMMAKAPPARWLSPDDEEEDGEGMEAMVVVRCFVFLRCG